MEVDRSAQTNPLTRSQSAARRSIAGPARSCESARDGYETASAACFGDAVRVRVARAEQQRDLPLDVVLDPDYLDVGPVEKQIGRPRVRVKGGTDASAIGDCERADSADEWSVDMPVHHFLRFTA